MQSSNRQNSSDDVLISEVTEGKGHKSTSHSEANFNLPHQDNSITSEKLEHNMLSESSSVTLQPEKTDDKSKNASNEKPKNSSLVKGMSSFL